MIPDYFNIEEVADGAVESAALLPKPQPPKPDGGCSCDLSVVDALPLGMTYVPMQVFRNLYTPEKALERGTLFCELDLPFRGGSAR